MAEADKEFYRVSEVARKMGVSKNYVLDAIKQGELKANKRGGYKGRMGLILIAAESYRNWLKNFFQPL